MALDSADMSQLTDASAYDVGGRTGMRWWIPPLLEGITSFAVAALFVWSCTFIRVAPLDRLGQVAGLAALGFRFFLFSAVLLAALVIAKRTRNDVALEMTTRLVCASLAGIATAMIAGGILVALRGTPWGLNGRGGDAGALATWATALHNGEAIPPTYPPLSLHVLHYYSDLVNLLPELALKHLQIAGVAIVGPFAYLAWRFLLPPAWALAIGVIASLPLVEPYKPFPNIVLIVFLPLAILYLKALRESATRSTPQLARTAILFGLAFGLACLMYSGWFQWAAPGLFVAALALFPWREGPRKGALLLALTGLVFTLITAKYLGGLLLDPAGKIADNYVYFDVRTEPMYIALWRNDTPGNVGVWPPIGEVGGVGLYTILLALGLGAAIALGRRTTVVIGTAAIMAGAWFMRFFFARQMWETKLVQLYPRTTPLILYSLIVLCGFAAFWLSRRLAAQHPLRGSSGLIGALCALMLVFASAGSATADRFMPVNSDPPGAGWLTYNAHLTKWGEFPRYKSRALRWLRRQESDTTAAPDSGTVITPDSAAIPDDRSPDVPEAPPR